MPYPVSRQMWPVPRPVPPPVQPPPQQPEPKKEKKEERKGAAKELRKLWRDVKRYATKLFLVALLIGALALTTATPTIQVEPITYKEVSGMYFIEIDVFNSGFAVATEVTLYLVVEDKYLDDTLAPYIDKEATTPFNLVGKSEMAKVGIDVPEGSSLIRMKATGLWPKTSFTFTLGFYGAKEDLPALRGKIVARNLVGFEFERQVSFSP